VVPTESSIYLADNAEILPRLPGGFFQLVYTDPPFNTVLSQRSPTTRVIAPASKACATGASS
jgi:16S rRNA G966 N2-methylase RsmD